MVAVAFRTWERQVGRAGHQENDEGRDDEHHEEHHDPKGLLLVGSYQLILHNGSGWGHIFIMVDFCVGKHGPNYLHNPESEVGEDLAQVLCVVEGGLVVAQGLVRVGVLLLLGQNIVPARVVSGPGRPRQASQDLLVIRIGKSFPSCFRVS